MPTRLRIMERVLRLTRARPKSPTLATPARVMRMFEDLHCGGSASGRKRATYIAVDDGRPAGVQVFQTSSNVQHEAKHSFE